MVDFKAIWGGVKKMGAASIDPLCRLIAGLAMMCIVVEVAYIVLIPLNTGWLALAIPILSYAAGYIVQGLFLHLTGYKIRDDGSYEGTRRFVDWKYALVPLAMAGIAALLMHDVFYDFFVELLHRGVLKQFDNYSLQPYACALALFLCAGAGIIVQFFPYGRLMNERVMVTCIGISLLCSLFMFQSLFTGILFAIYAACTILLMNQAYIMRSYRSLTVTKITTTARLYSMRMILLCLTLTALGSVVVFIVVNGLWRVILFLFYLLVYTIIAGRTGGSSRREDIVSSDEYVFGGNAMSEVMNKASLIGFIILAIFAVVFFIWGRTAGISNIIDAIKRWFDEFIAIFMGSRELEREPEINYKDEVETLDKVKISRTKQALNRSGKLTLRDFNSEMAALKTDEERLSYSYIIMIGLLSQLNTTLRPSNTPRELSDKIKSTMEFPAIEEITALIEEIKYAEVAADPALSERVLGHVRTMVERHLV